MDFPVRCTSPTCGRNIYGPVAFCPYCGTRFALSDDKSIPHSGEALKPQVVETRPEPVPGQQKVKGSSVTKPLSKSFPKTQAGHVKVSDAAKLPVAEQETSIPTSATVREEEDKKETDDSERSLTNSPPAGTAPIIQSTANDGIDRKKKSSFPLIAAAVGGVVLIGVAFFVFRGPGGSAVSSPVSPGDRSKSSIPSRNRGTKSEMDKRTPKDKSDPSSAAATAEVKIVTNPTGAVVSVDGEKWGISPAHVKNLPPGQHVFDISKSGFRDEHVNVILSKRDKKDLQVSLASLPPESHSPKPPLAPQRDEASDRDLAEAIRNYEQGKLDVSIVQFEAILRRDGTNPRAKEYLNLAISKRQKATEKWMQDIDTAPVTGGRKR